MSEDRFFEQVNKVMSSYSPEVPEAVYAGMRKKLWWSNFTRLSATRFNVWYLLLAITSVTMWLSLTPSYVADLPSQTTQHQASDETIHETTESATVPAQVVVNESEQSTLSQQPVQRPVAKQEQVVTAVATEESAEKATASHEGNSNPTNEQTNAVAPVTTQQAQSAPTTQPGSKKGLKVKTYQQTEKK